MTKKTKKKPKVCKLYIGDMLFYTLPHRDALGKAIEIPIFLSRGTFTLRFHYTNSSRERGYLDDIIFYGFE